MKRPQLDCHTCKGTGEMLMSTENYRCLKALERLEQATVMEIWKSLKEPIDITACNNRMRRLMNAGYVRRTNKHKPWIYELCNPEKWSP